MPLVISIALLGRAHYLARSCMPAANLPCPASPSLAAMPQSTHHVVMARGTSGDRYWMLEKP